MKLKGINCGLICVRYRYTLMAEAARWRLMLSNDMHSVFSSNFLLISKYNCGARNGKHIPLALHKGDLSRVIFIYILPCWDLWELLHGYVLTFKIYLSAFTSTPPTVIFNGVIFPTLQIKCFFLFMKGLFMKKAVCMNCFSNYGCWLRAYAMHCMNCIKMRFTGLLWAILMIWLFTVLKL